MHSRKRDTSRCGKNAQSDGKEKNQGKGKRKRKGNKHGAAKEKYERSNSAEY